jgi:hypothetical protein|tara:strand:- start:961 stop:1278 length:318 start_codon:yes stop_codon:yes gene_type:complete
MYFLFILSVKSILSSVIGSSFYNWFKDTHIGIWFQFQVNRFMDHFAEKHDIELARTESKFKKDYPLIAERLEYLESIAHPKCGIEEFDGYQKLIDMIEARDKKQK